MKKIPNSPLDKIKEFELRDLRVSSPGNNTTELDTLYKIRDVYGKRQPIYDFDQIKALEISKLRIPSSVAPRYEYTQLNPFVPVEKPEDDKSDFDKNEGTQGDDIMDISKVDFARADFGIVA